MGTYPADELYAVLGAALERLHQGRQLLTGGLRPLGPAAVFGLVEDARRRQDPALEEAQEVVRQTEEVGLQSLGLVRISPG